MENKKEIIAGIKQVSFACALSVAVSLVLVLLFALAIKIFSLPSSVIVYVNQAIKAASVFAGCFFFLRGERGLLKGLLSGVLTVFFTALIFTAIGGEGNFSPVILLESLFGGIIGAITGILAVNLHK